MVSNMNGVGTSTGWKGVDSGLAGHRSLSFFGHICSKPQLSHSVTWALLRFTLPWSIYCVVIINCVALMHSVALIYGGVIITFFFAVVLVAVAWRSP